MTGNIIHDYGNLNLKEYFGQLINSPVLFLPSPIKTLINVYFVQEWLDLRNVTSIAKVKDLPGHSGY